METIFKNQVFGLDEISFRDFHYVFHFFIFTFTLKWNKHNKING